MQPSLNLHLMLVVDKSLPWTDSSLRMASNELQKVENLSQMDRLKMLTPLRKSWLQQIFMVDLDLNNSMNYSISLTQKMSFSGNCNSAWKEWIFTWKSNLKLKNFILVQLRKGLLRLPSIATKLNLTSLSKSSRNCVSITKLTKRWQMKETQFWSQMMTIERY